jgi:hypothetical protein
MTERIIVKMTMGLAGFVLVVLLYQSLFWVRFTVPPPAVPKKPVVEAPCYGTAITVNEPYLGVAVNPHSCIPQCEDDQPRYLVYTNGKATQCEEPPGCNDYGEDNGITCKPPNMTTK